MTFRGETSKNYVTGVVRKRGEELQRALHRAGSPNAWKDDDIQTRFRYNQAFLSVNAMVPSIFMLLLCLIPAIMSAIAVVREKETGSIANFRSTPITQLEYLVGKQLPYIAIAMANFVVLLLIAIFIFRVPVKGPFLVLLVGTLVYVVATVGFGVLISSFTRTQVAAVFATAILSIVPAVNFSGMLAPVSSLSGGAKIIGLSFPPPGTSRFRSAYSPRRSASPTSGATSPRSGSSRLSSWPCRWPCSASRRRELSQASSPPGLAEAKPLTFVDHVINIFHLVIKELRSIRADPVMLLLVVYSFSISVNTVATGAVTEATNLSVGIVDEDSSDLSRRIAEGLRRPTFQPPVQITASDIDPMMDQGKLLFVVEIPPNFEADIRAQRQTGLQMNVDATAVARRATARALSATRSPPRSSGSSPAARVRPARRSISSCAPPSTRTSRQRGFRR